MSNVLRSKKTDLEIIQRLERIVGKKLRKLDKIERDSIGYMQNEQNQVITLCLYGYDQREFPLEIFQLRHLTSLTLNSGQLSTLPDEITQMHNLTHLNLGRNQLSTLPAEIGLLHNLTAIHLSKNQLSSLPAEIGLLHNLTALHLSNNQLSSLPAEIGQLHNLTKLNLDSNQLSTLPAEIGQLHNLTKLNLDSNQLSTLPAEIGQLQNLTECYLCNNQLSTVPAAIGQLQNLTNLSLDRYQLSFLQAEIWQLHKLKHVDLSNNKLTQFPKALLELNLQVKWDRPNYDNHGRGGFHVYNICDWYGIHVHNNPFEIPPVEIVKQGRQAIVDYYAALEQPANRPLHEAKLILIGDGAAGKTSLMKRLLGQTFDPQESQTHGININTLLLPDPHDNQIKLHCWDFGGQQIMHATHQFFLSKRCLYLLVIDSRRETQVEYWLKHIQAFGDNAPVIIVINKIDENPHFNLPQQRQLKQRYPNIQNIHRISCRTDQGLNELKNIIQNTLPAIDLLNTLVPATWFNVKTAITDQSQHSNFASYDQYVELCQRHGINSDSEQTTLINFLHDLGIINHFPDRWLRETNVINPQWLTEAVYTIINAPHLAGNGKLHRNDLTTLLDNTTYPERKHDYILELMQKFELCYALNADEYLLPDLFPVAEPDFTFDHSHALHFIVEYDFLPKAIFTSLVIKLHHEIVPNTYWRNGVLLRNDLSNTVALIETTTNPNRITLQISGSQQQEYLVILRFMLQDINRRFNQLRVIEKIGLPDDPSLSVDYAYLLRLVENGQSHYIPPENSTTSYKLSALLGIVTQPTESELLSRINTIIQMLEAQGLKAEKDLRDHITEVIKFSPSVFGLSVDVNALLRKVWPHQKA